MIPKSFKQEWLNAVRDEERRKDVFLIIEMVAKILGCRGDELEILSTGEEIKLRAKSQEAREYQTIIEESERAS